MAPIKPGVEGDAFESSRGALSRAVARLAGAQRADQLAAGPVVRRKVPSLQRDLGPHAVARRSLVGQSRQPLRGGGLQRCDGVSAGGGHVTDEPASTSLTQNRFLDDYGQDRRSRSVARVAFKFRCLIGGKTLPRERAICARNPPACATVARGSKQAPMRGTNENRKPQPCFAVPNL